MSELVTVSIDVNKLHTCTTAIVVESGSLTQVNGNTLLRVDTMKGIMQEEVDRVNKELAYNAELADKINKAAPAVAPMAMPAQYPQQTATLEDVVLNPHEFQQLLQQLKTVATDTNRNAVKTPHLTHMEIHERLLAMKVHK